LLWALHIVIKQQFSYIYIILYDMIITKQQDKLTAVGFVTAVFTVTPSIASGRQWDACATATTKLIPTTRCTSYITNTRSTYHTTAICIY